MNNKYTFWELCNSYSKIEVPIIQRDYAQGRNTVDVQKLRNKFVDDYLIKSILKDENIELDFVYGSILTETKDDVKQNRWSAKTNNIVFALLFCSIKREAFGRNKRSAF